MLIQHLPIGYIGPEQMIFMIPMTALAGWIVSMFIKHQQRMAEIIHGNANQQSNSEIGQLRQEVYELKQLVHEQTIALDSYARAPRISTDTSMQRRLEEV